MVAKVAWHQRKQLLSPPLIAILAPLQIILQRVFSAEELEALDSDDVADEHPDN